MNSQGYSARLMKSAWAGLTIFAFSSGLAAAEPVKTITPGKLTVGFNGDMPMTSLKDGKLIGTDGELISRIAEKLGLEIEPRQMEWSGAIQATKQGQVDLMLGSMGWTKDRTKVFTMTDPIYYYATTFLQKKENNFTTFDDMKGHSIGTVTGFTPIPEMKTVPGVTEVKLYDTSDAVIRDVVAGRLDIALIDPTLVEYALLQHPAWGLHQLPVKPEPDRYPIMSTKYYAIISVWPENKDLYTALNAEVQKAWADCLNVEVMTKYGLGADFWFKGPEPDYRNGVDRPADWKSPSSPEKCFKK
jgi:polar amino acid transport system substrate-binding protein